MLFLAGALGFFYWGYLNGQRFIWDDTLQQFYPFVSYVARSISQGRFPLWFPGLHDGMPLYCDPQLSVLYPPQWLLIPFVQGDRLPFVVYQRYIVLHYFAGGLFTYAFLRQLKFRPVAALTGAIVFCLSGFASLHIVNFVLIQTYAWLPLQLLCIHRLTGTRSRWAWLGLVGAMLMSLLAGHQQTTVYCWYLVIAYWLYRGYSVGHSDAPGRWAKARRVVVRDLPKLAGTFVVVFALGASLLIPAAQNWLHTARARQPFEIIADTSLPYCELLSLLVPNYFGQTQGESPVEFWGYDARSWTVVHNPSNSGLPGYWQYWEFGVYAGQIFWIALLVILSNWRRIDDRRTAGFFVISGVVGLWFMLGRYGGLFQVLYHILPGASLFRGPAKMACVVTFAGAVLSACAIDQVARASRGLRSWPVFLPAAAGFGLALVLSTGGDRLPLALLHLGRLDYARSETLFAAAVAVVCAVALVGAVRLPRRWMQMLFLGVIPIACVVDFSHAYGFFQCGHFDPDQFYTNSDPLLPRLQQYREQFGPVRFGQIVANTISEGLSMARNDACFYDFVEVPEGYTSFYLDSVASFQSITNRPAKLDIQNIKVIMEVDATGTYYLGTRSKAFLRARFFGRARQFDSRAALLSALESGQIDWYNEAAVAGPLTTALPTEMSQASGTNSDGEVQFESITPESYAVTYNVKRPGVILVSQAFYPGWVTDDERIKLIEVFGAFQGLVIPEPGQGRVRVRFSPPALKWGSAITLLGVAACAVTVFRKRPRPS
ncbi:MAG TPA: YfhO family protein [Verrucomicrobiae bacterium]|nr:YfhO family protein [Verrucomicrobiae bacterium]